MGQTLETSAACNLSVCLTAQTLGNVDLQLDIAEEHGQGHGEVALRPQRDVAISGLEVLKREDALAEHLAVVVVDGEAEHGELREDDLERERVFGTFGSKSQLNLHFRDGRRRETGEWNAPELNFVPRYFSSLGRRRFAIFAAINWDLLEFRSRERKAPFPNVHCLENVLWSISQ